MISTTRRTVNSLITIVIVTVVLIGLCSCPVESRTMSSSNNHQRDFQRRPSAQMTIQMCRYSCMGRFLSDSNNESEVKRGHKIECSGRPDCFMCWDYCGMLYSEHKVIVGMMCDDEICFNGCKHACKFYNGLPWKLKRITIKRQSSDIQTD